MDEKIKKIIGAIVAIIVGILCGIGVHVAVTPTGEIETKVEIPEAVIEYSEEDASIPEVTEGVEGVEYGQGEVTVDGEEIKTVESVDATGPQVNFEDEVPCPEGEECGRGATYPYVDTSTPEAFINATLGGCYDVDGYYNEQCWDYAALFFLNYAGHTFYTCGTGAAKGAIVDGCWQKNAGDEFVMIWDPTQLQPGDIAVFNNGTFGHVGDVTGYYNNGYITLAGQNQGGGLCAGSTMGARVNIINISLKYFAGAFRPKSYIKPEPTPEPTPVIDDCKTIEVKAGDTLGAIMKRCKGKAEWGEAMNEYARHWFSTKYALYPTVYDGWASLGGYGLFAGDVIEYRD